MSAASLTTVPWSEDAARHLRACGDPVMAALATRLPPIALELGAPYFHRLAVAIINQQISGHAARSIMGRVTAQLGEPLSPEAVAAASDDALRGCGLSAAKLRSLRDLAAHTLDGRLDLAALPALADEEIINQLVAVRGIGRWTAEMFLLFALGRPDVLPVGDYGLRAALRRGYGLAALPGPKEVHALAAPWRPYASAATHYLWRSLDTPPPLEAAADVQ